MIYYAKSSRAALDSPPRAPSVSPPTDDVSLLQSTGVAHVLISNRTHIVFKPDWTFTPRKAHFLS